MNKTNLRILPLNGKDSNSWNSKHRRTSRSPCSCFHFGADGEFFPAKFVVVWKTRCWDHNQFHNPERSTCHYAIPWECKSDIYFSPAKWLWGSAPTDRISLCGISRTSRKTNEAWPYRKNTELATQCQLFCIKIIRLRQLWSFVRNVRKFWFYFPCVKECQGPSLTLLYS